jgi:YrbI family 3-deoxy-D-manno-octulosonate 8-phosphate phosphatase
MSVVAVIPVSDPVLAGRTLAGRPLLAHSLDQVLSARHIGRVVVLTHDEPIAGLARSVGALTSALPAEGDDSAAQLREAISRLEPDTGFVAAVAVLLAPEFPLRSASTLDAAIEHLGRVGADTLLSVSPLLDPLWVRDGEGLAQPADMAPTRQRFLQNGAIVAVQTAAFEREEMLPAGRIVLFEVSPLEALRIRGEDDWRVAEALVRRVRVRDIVARLRTIRLLALDFDGVMTDNRVLVFEDGGEAVLCNRSDGLGLDHLRAAGLAVVVISKEKNAVVGARCRKLSLPCYQGVEDKLAVLRQIAEGMGVALSDVAFVGNDVNDLPCLGAAGLAIAPADAHPEVIRQVHFVTAAAGGVGAVREICDLWLAASTKD